MTDARELRERLDELKYVAGELRPALDALLNEPEPERVRAAIVARVCGMLEDAATAERQRCAAALERLEALEAALPKSGDGVTLHPGAKVYREYLGSVWHAEVVSVGREGIDLQYTNDASHGAKWAISRRASPSKWFSTPAPAGALNTTDQT